MTESGDWYGVHPEGDALRKVLVCAPGLAHSRLTPSNCDSLLFDDVLWVQNAKRDHADFMVKMQDRGIEVVEMHELLTQTLADPEAKKWLLDRQIIANEVGLGLVAETRGFLESLDTRQLSEVMIGGLSAVELPDKYQSEYLTMVREATGSTEILAASVTEHFVYMRHYMLDLRGVTLNALFWAARHEETLLMAAIHKYHPSFKDAGFPVWWGDPDSNHGSATLEGRDVLVPGNGVMLIGMSEPYLASGDYRACR